MPKLAARAVVIAVAGVSFRLAGIAGEALAQGKAMERRP